MSVLQKRIRPSISQGYARSVGESAHPELWRGLAADWFMSLGPTGAVARDYAPGKSHGDLTSMNPNTDWVIANNRLLPGRALDFDGINDRVRINFPYAPALIDIDVGHVTFCCWALTRSFIGGGGPRFFQKNSRAIFNQNAGSSSIQYRQLFTGTTGNWRSASSTVVFGQWQHFAVTYGLSTVSTVPTFYVNGDPVSTVVISTPTGTPLLSGTGDIGLGATSVATNPFDGQIGHICVYNRVLSAAEIRLRYLNAAAPYVLKARKRFFVALNVERTYPRAVLRGVGRGVI